MLDYCITVWVNLSRNCLYVYPYFHYVSSKIFCLYEMKLLFFMELLMGQFWIIHVHKYMNIHEDQLTVAHGATCYTILTIWLGLWWWILVLKTSTAVFLFNIGLFWFCVFCCFACFQQSYLESGFGTNLATLVIQRQLFFSVKFQSWRGNIGCTDISGAIGISCRGVFKVHSLLKIIECFLKKNVWTH